MRRSITPDVNHRKASKMPEHFDVSQSLYRASLFFVSSIGAFLVISLSLASLE
jgi:hypothetical protein